MATATIYRPQCEINFTSLPNDIFNFGHHYDLKARDVAVLNYLLSKPEKWNINRKAIANAVNMCERTVSTALSVLQELGFAGYKRVRGGKTEWFVSLPDFSTESHIAKNPIEVISPCKIYPVLETNDLLERNKETTNAVVVDLPDYINKTDAVKNELGALDAKLQVTVLKMLADAMLCAGKIKTTPTAYFLGMVRNAAKGCLSSAVEKAVVKSVDKKRGFIQKNLEKLRCDLKTTADYVCVPGIGNIGLNDLKEFETSGGFYA